ncbi:hypothetical protein [Paraflavitalea speifideaquila]|uniref:hypothetical protein n=1 Tax=Paraflavitalea speifideaquila TaxID=3076558 RepID=UPI0028EFC4D1|nr:hypothetical protein [Paraflavitalea speifideiaquila]
MKIRLYGILLLMLFLCTSILYSCSKDGNPSSPEKTPEQILTGVSWKIDEIRSQIGNIPYSYKRGSPNHELDNEYITFRNDHTGTYVAPNGTQYQISTWNFVDSPKTKLQYTIAFSTPLVVNWEIMAMKPDNIKYGEYHVSKDGPSLAYATRIPR